MDGLSSLLAAELKASLAQSADVAKPVSGRDIIGDEKSRGVRLFVNGTVQEASWIRSRSGGGSYRLKVSLSAALAKSDAPDLQEFWAKTIELEAPHRGRPTDDMLGLARKVLDGAVEDMGKALKD
jgi:hypothetical protein